VTRAVTGLALLAFLFFTLAAAIYGGIIAMASPGWLVPGGLAALTLAGVLDRVP
jgi:hypothetical protein